MPIHINVQKVGRSITFGFVVAILLGVIYGNYLHAQQLPQSIYRADLHLQPAPPVNNVWIIVHGGAREALRDFDFISVYKWELEEGSGGIYPPRELVIGNTLGVGWTVRPDPGETFTSSTRVRLPGRYHPGGPNYELTDVLTSREYMVNVRGRFYKFMMPESATLNSYPQVTWHVRLP